jgi:hypothetical protein
MPLTILSNGDDDWQVWIQLQAGNPIGQHESFIIGDGETRAAAVQDAVKTLGTYITQLEAPGRSGFILERAANGRLRRTLPGVDSLSQP